MTQKKLGPIGSVVLTFIGYKQTGKPNLCRWDYVRINLSYSYCFFKLFSKAYIVAKKNVKEEKNLKHFKILKLEP